MLPGVSSRAAAHGVVPAERKTCYNLFLAHPQYLKAGEASEPSHHAGRLRARGERSRVPCAPPGDSPSPPHPAPNAS